ncbi:hypothetical protein [Streptomyces sp. NPDC050560]|uniref:hypothetical protein n=1 Tax=Streptomyces sp. NPDC050560 TaxID=3365630 RepID=UPI0037A05532
MADTGHEPPAADPGPDGGHDERDVEAEGARVAAEAQRLADAARLAEAQRRADDKHTQRQMWWYLAYFLFGIHLVAFVMIFAVLHGH